MSDSYVGRGGGQTPARDGRGRKAQLQLLGLTSAEESSYCPTSTGAMDIDEAAAIVAGPRAGRWSEALQALRDFIEQEARAARASSDEADDIAQIVLLNVFPRLQSGDRVWETGNHRAYLRAAARNRLIDLRRRGKKDQAVPTPVELVDDGGEHVQATLAPARHLIAAVAAAARARRAERYQSAFDHVWNDLQALVNDESTLEKILTARLEPGADRVLFVKARNRAYKAHERIRAELLAAVGPMRDSGRLSAEDAELVLRALRVFVRCQRQPTSPVSARKGSP